MAENSESWKNPKKKEKFSKKKCKKIQKIGFQIFWIQKFLYQTNIPRTLMYPICLFLLFAHILQSFGEFSRRSIAFWTLMLSSTHLPMDQLLRFFEVPKIRCPKKPMDFINFLSGVEPSDFRSLFFAVHFIYRYGAADLAFQKKYLAGKKLIFLFLAPLVYGIWWTAVVLTMFQPSPESDEFMRINIFEPTKLDMIELHEYYKKEIKFTIFRTSLFRIPFLRRYDTQLEHISYVIVWFYTPSGEVIWSTFLAVVCNWFMMFTSFFCVIYFGIKCYLKIKKALKTSKMSSYYTKSIQNQLFQALVIQTLIPFLLMYAPVGMLFSFPMLNTNVGFISGFVAATIAIYPAVDPLPTMFNVKNYRKTILCGCFRKKSKKDNKNAVELG
ncbi:Protein CBG06399 [Caenorhabditis briggsae]|uniref:Protein CBG06399 n=1 Tax=Caenorhabditis briggsae TaxID=6238 RepID=A8X253_CAEBR|nr:Protein CBG06399 [Caenorhabditis briggsae]CAP26713.1 Protein CBG06399 [Caenorhabditis briggsae]